MVLANDLEGGFKNINAMNKTSQTLDSKTYTEVETHEVEPFVRYGNTGCGVFKQGVQIKKKMPKNQHTQRKSLNFTNMKMSKSAKI